MTREPAAIRVYSLDANVIAGPVQLRPNMELAPNGEGFAGVLERLRDDEPERFEALNAEFARWLPEQDRILLDTPQDNSKGFRLRTRKGRHKIPAYHLSHGDRLALALLTLVYTPNPPSLIGLEEPDRGIHPRLLRELQTALYRLSFPEQFGEKRPAVQLIITTHSPYLLDLYRDHPEQVVIAHKRGLDAHFERLSDRKEVAEVLAGAPLGEVWYSGVLGGVPGEP